MEAGRLVVRRRGALSLAASNRTIAYHCARDQWLRACMPHSLVICWWSIYSHGSTETVDQAMR